MKALQLKGWLTPGKSRNWTSGNSDMIPGPEEKGVVRAQFARFASTCRIYAPMYRQVTLTALRTAVRGTPIPVDRALAYNDILDAWNYYLCRTSTDIAGPTPGR